MRDADREIMADLFYFLRDFNDPPPSQDPRCIEFWERAAKQIHEVVDIKWKGHPLATEAGCAIYRYLEGVCKASGASGG